MKTLMPRTQNNTNKDLVIMAVDELFKGFKVKSFKEFLKDKLENYNGDKKNG